MKIPPKSSTPTLALLVALLATIATLSAQDAPRSGTYQIQSGYYTIDSIAGPRTYRLPDPSQAFVSLVMGPAVDVATLTFLTTNQQTPFLRLTNGIVTGNTIRFQYLGVHPSSPTRPAQVDYLVTNAAGRLSINGSISMINPMPDFPNRLEHRAVGATILPALSIRLASQVELHWCSATNQQYQVQFLTDLTNPSWTNLGAPIPGNGTTSSAVDPAPPFPPQKFYRILILP